MNDFSLTTQNILPETTDGFRTNSSGSMQKGLPTASVVSSTNASDENQFDVIIIGAGFAGLVAARELSLRNRRVLIVESRDRIGGRTFTSQFENDRFEIGGTWIHWSQPHVWTEVTRYGLTLKESKGAQAETLNVLLDNGIRLKQVSSKDSWCFMGKAMSIFSDVDGVQGRKIMPLPHAPLTEADTIAVYDRLSMKDRLDQIVQTLNIDDEIYQMFVSLLSMNMQGDIAEGGFVDHLRWWALGDYDMERMFEKLGRYKIKEGTTALARAILNDCHQVKLLLSTPIQSIDHSNVREIYVRSQSGELFRGRTVIVTVPLNVLSKIDFQPALQREKQDAIGLGQCRGGTKFWVKLEKPIGHWFAFAPYPNPITMVYSDDDEGGILVGFGPDQLLDIKNVHEVENQLKKFHPEIKVLYVLGHDWRNDPFVLSTWSWYKPNQISSSLRLLQKSEGSIFFASGDLANGWRGFIDGAIESGLDAARQVHQYLN